MGRVLERWLLSVVIVTLMGGCATGQRAAPPQVDTAAVESAIASLNTSFTAAMAARDTDTVANFYADDARFLPANGPRADGRQAIRAAWASFLRMPGLSLTPQSSQILISDAGDMVVDIGTYHLKMDGPKGPIEDVGKYVTVLKQVGGEWKVVVDIFNSDMPAPGQ